MKRLIQVLAILLMVFFISCGEEPTAQHGLGGPCATVNDCLPGLDCIDSICVTREVTTDEDNEIITDNGNNDADSTTKPDEPETVDDDSGTLCEPDAFLRCSDTDKNVVIRCNSAGTDVLEISCGEDGTCYDDMCHQKQCEPGESMCVAEDLDNLYECDEDGKGPTTEPTGVCVGGTCKDGACQTLCEMNAEDHSYEGCDYFTANLHNETQRSDPIFAIVVSNINKTQNMTIDITISDDGTTEKDAGKVYFCVNNSSGCSMKSSSKAITIAPGQIAIFQYPHDRMLKETGVTTKAYHIVTSVPATVYQFSPFDNSFDNPFESSGNSVDYSFFAPEYGQSFSNDASLLIPITSVYTHYRSVSFHNLDLDDPAVSNFITIIGTSDSETEIVVTPTADIKAGGGVPAISAGASHTFIIKKFSTINLEATGKKVDLTGTLIECKDTTSKCEPFVVFSGNSIVNLPVEEAYADHMQQQLFPIETWGKEFVVVKTQVRGEESDLVRVIAAEDNTTITYSPSVPAALPPYLTSPAVETIVKAGGISEFYFKDSISITADKPVLVAQYLAGSQMISAICKDGDYNAHVDPANNCVGDPAMILIPPVEQFRTSYSFLTPGSYQSNYATILLADGVEPVVDGTKITDITDIADSPYSYAIVDLGAEFASHTLTCDPACGLFVYGWEMDVSYAYPGGLNLKKVNDNY